jgi:hypothetical protein
MPEKGHYPKPASGPLVIRGTLSKLKPEDARRLAVYLVQGDEVIARTQVPADGTFQLAVSRAALTARPGLRVEAVVGPAAMGKQLDTTRNLQRVALDPAALERDEVVVPTETLDLSDEVLRLWWLWCRTYSVTGRVVGPGPDHCPVPYAQVTAASVQHAVGGGFSVTPQATAVADAAGHFTIHFEWCSFCWGWPCRPLWWHCWPWWWEWDILHVIQQLEARPRIGPVGPGPVELASAAPGSRAMGLPLKQPDSADLMIGQGFAAARRQDERLVPDPARTTLIRRKLVDPAIRAIFPWWWWCCPNPNLIFTVRQGATVILNEDPATQTRWCLPGGSDVTLTGNDLSIPSCAGDGLPAQGFVWTRVGNTLVSQITQGYAQGDPSSYASDMAFTGELDIFGGFAGEAPGSPGSSPQVAYYQVNAALWSGNPARGGTPPPGEGDPLGTDLYNYAFMLHPDSSVTVEAVKMGPFDHAGLTNLYATEAQRALVDPSLLPAFPAGTFLAWAYEGLKITAPAGSLIGGSLGAVRLGVTAYQSDFTPLLLPINTDDHLTLEIDTTGLTVEHIFRFQAYNDMGALVYDSNDPGLSPCPDVDIGKKNLGYVVLNVAVRDDNGHLAFYELVPDYGHSLAGTTIPDVRGYNTPTPFVPAPAPGPYSEPVVAQKSFVGGTENITFYPQVTCCYDFRLVVGKRVTNGYGWVGSYTADFWTATVKVSS